MATTLHVTTSPGPILAAIARHRAAFDAFQVAPEGRPTDLADIEMREALSALLVTPCGSRFGCLALLTHLRWWLIEETDFADDYAPEYGIAASRALDLTLFLGEHAPRVVAALPAPALAARLSTATTPVLTEPGETWCHVSPLRPDTAHVRAPRVIDAIGEVVAAIVLIAGGAVLTALATLA